MKEEREPTREIFRGLRLGRPSPALRANALRAVRQALDKSEPAATLPGWQGWWREWRLEAALATAIVFCASLAPVLGRPAADLHPAQATAEADLELIAEPDLDSIESSYYQYRQAIARRFPKPEPRYPTDDKYNSRILALDAG